MDDRINSPDAVLVWESILPGHGNIVAVMLSILAEMPKDVFIEAINNIGRVETVGPLMDPTAFLDGKKFSNARDYKAVLGDLDRLRSTLANLGVFVPNPVPEIPLKGGL